MNLTEWLERRVDYAAGRHDSDNSTSSVVRINQTMLSDVIWAVEVNDKRLTRIEKQLGIEPFAIPSNGDALDDLIR